MGQKGESSRLPLPHLDDPRIKHILRSSDGQLIRRNLI